MGKGKRLRGQRKRSAGGVLSELSACLTAHFQRDLRQSELWEAMVAKFGEERAEELLRECRAGVRPGLPDGSRDRPTDIS
jgi:hypothetical protein